jgi:hypothetical protein
VLTNFGETGMTWSQGEFTGDGTVDINDLTIVLSNFGAIGSAGAVVRGLARHRRHRPCRLRLAKAKVSLVDRPA